MLWQHWVNIEIKCNESAERIFCCNEKLYLRIAYNEECFMSIVLSISKHDKIVRIVRHIEYYHNLIPKLRPVACLHESLTLHFKSIRNDIRSHRIADSACVVPRVRGLCISQHQRTICVPGYSGTRKMITIVYFFLNRNIWVLQMWPSYSVTALGSHWTMF